MLIARGTVDTGLRFSLWLHIGNTDTSYTPPVFPQAEQQAPGLADTLAGHKGGAPLLGAVQGQTLGF